MRKLSTVFPLAALLAVTLACSGCVFGPCGPTFYIPSHEKPEKQPQPAKPSSDVKDSEMATPATEK
jgi:hypothetical protein